MKEEDDRGATALMGARQTKTTRSWARLCSASYEVKLASRDAVRQPSEPRSDKAAFDRVGLRSGRCSS